MRTQQLGSKQIASSYSNTRPEPNLSAHMHFEQLPLPAVRRVHILITGSIGVGKSSVIHALSRSSSGFSVFEENPESYLEQFYADPPRFAFHNELAYAVQFLEQSLEISRTNGIVVQERSIYDTVRVFSVLWHEDGAISDNELTLLHRLMNLAKLIATPTRVFLLHATPRIALERIRTRARPGEQLITSDYLSRLSLKYDSWFAELDINKERISTDDATPDEIANHIISCLQ